MSFKIFCDQCQSEVALAGSRYSLSTNYVSLDFDKTSCISDWLAANADPGTAPDPEPTPDPEPDPEPEPEPETDPAPEDDDPSFRDASSGQYVTEDYATDHPDTTVSES